MGQGSRDGLVSEGRIKERQEEKIDEDNFFNSPIRKESNVIKSNPAHTEIHSHTETRWW